MKTQEQIIDPSFNFEDFDFGLDVNGAFQEAMFGVASNKEIELSEKIRRMEVIIDEGSSELYRDFVDFRSLAAQIEFLCNHDHDLNEASQSNETISSFLEKNRQREEASNGESLQDKSKKDKKEAKGQRLFSFFGGKNERGKGLLAFLLQSSK